MFIESQLSTYAVGNQSTRNPSAIRFFTTYFKKCRKSIVGIIIIMSMVLFAGSSHEKVTFWQQRACRQENVPMALFVGHLYQAHKPTADRIECEDKKLLGQDDLLRKAPLRNLPLRNSPLRHRGNATQSSRQGKGEQRAGHNGL
jgi:hypothetical protein